jgi:spore germination protein GerM
MKNFIDTTWRIVFVCLGCLIIASACKDSSDHHSNAQTTPQENNGLSESLLVHLYFSDNDNLWLKAENRQLSGQNDPVALGTQIIQALLKGPQKTLVPTIPERTALNAFYVTQNSVAFVDLSEAVKENHSGGAKSELLTIYSIVNSLILNMNEIEAVKILIDGREVSTLAGHVDLRFPLKANMLLIR